jgi:hypothetical protein
LLGRVVPNLHVVGYEVSRAVPLVATAQGGGFNPLALLRPGPPAAPEPAGDLLVRTPPFIDPKDVGRPVPGFADPVTVDPCGFDVEPGLPPAPRLDFGDGVPGEVADIAGNADVEVAVVVLVVGVEDELDDAVRVEILPHRARDVPLYPRQGGVGGVVVEPDDEVTEVAAAVERPAVG